MSGKIDDPIDAAFETFPNEPDGLGSKFADLALSFGGLVFLPAAIAKILKDQFQSENRRERVYYLVRAVSDAIKELESQVGADREKISEIQARIDSPRFQEAVATACEEASRASTTKNLKRFSAVLTGSLSPGIWADADADLVAMIRDLAQLGDQDIHTLVLLRTAFAEVIAHLPNLHDPNRFTEKMQDYRDAIRRSKLHPDDFYASCARLSGFGLAIEVLRNNGRMRIEEHCFRPTRRGLALLDSLDRFGSGGN
jgi:hypothetical protein